MPVRDPKDFRFFVRKNENLKMYSAEEEKAKNDPPSFLREKWDLVAEYKN